MTSLTPPGYIADYPTGKHEPMGRNLRATAHDSSNYFAPLQNQNRSLAAIIMPISRPISNVRDILRQNMRLCERHGIQLVALCSGAARASEFATLTKDFEMLAWTAVGGPFTFGDTNFDFTSCGAPFGFPSEHDLAAKRNFGLLLARHMGWSYVLFADDDIRLTDALISKQIALARQGAVLAAHNSRDYPDHSVVVGAYRELYGAGNVDTYLSSQALLLSVEDGLLSFYPQIYNEDWLFILPYVLKHGKAIWSGSVKQREYNRFVRQRARHEEAGDLIAEGLMRLAVDIVANRRDRTYGELLEALAERADATFWEKEILRRAVFIRELLLRSSPRFLRPKSVRIQGSLKVSLRTLVGDDSHSGLDPEQIACWVTAWVDDLKRWCNFKVEPLARRSIAAALQELNAQERSLYRDLGRVPGIYSSDADHADNPVAQALCRLPAADRHASQVRGVASTWVLSQYMKQRQLRFEDIRRATKRLRYDRPIRSLIGNKPVGTVVMVVRWFESVESIGKSFRRIIDWNTGAKPIHVIVWIIPEHRVSGYYREYLMAQLMLETSGTNIRLLSCIGHPTPEPELDVLTQEIIGVVGLAYWKNGIAAVGHMVAIANTDGEPLFSGDLATLQMGVPGRSDRSLPEIIESMNSPEEPTTLRTPEELRANSLIRQRLLHRTARSQRTKGGHEVQAAVRLRKSMKAAGMSWLAIDDQHHQTHIHHERGDEALVQTDHVAVVPIRYGTDLTHAESALDQALAKFARLRSSIGRTADVNFVIYGPESPAEFNAYRARLVEELRFHRELPQFTTLVTHVLPSAAVDDPSRLPKIAQAMVRYEYWLANDSAAPTLLWVTANRRGRSRIVKRRPSLFLENLQLGEGSSPNTGALAPATRS